VLDGAFFASPKYVATKLYVPGTVETNGGLAIAVAEPEPGAPAIRGTVTMYMGVPKQPVLPGPYTENVTDPVGGFPDALVTMTVSVIAVPTVALLVLSIPRMVVANANTSKTSVQGVVCAKLLASPLYRTRKAYSPAAVGVNTGVDRYTPFPETTTGKDV
jgi:hypothetical protein